ncbi:MAG: glycoside hydrolase family 43 protein, partial [Acidimicrobiales bacterium]
CPWDLLALGFGSLLIPLRRWPNAVWPLVAGVAAGEATVRAASGAHAPWWAWPAVAVAVALGTVVCPWPRRPAGRGRIPAVVGIALVAVLTVGVAAHDPWARLPRSADAGSRFLTWSSAVDQWRSSKLTGVGAERVYNSRVPVSTYPGFAADSYLTITADSGLIGAVLLLGVGAAVAFAVRRRDALSSAAAGAVIAFVVAGNVDFGWQLPALGLVAGCLVGLASPVTRPPPDEPPAPSAEPPRPPRRTGRWLRATSKPVLLLVCIMVVAAEMVVGDTHIASAGAGTVDLTPPPSLTPSRPARTILSGPDATDPFMLHVGKLFYLYTSEGDFGASAYNLNVPVWIGTRIGHWRAPIDVLPTLPGWVSWGATWAPDVRKVSGDWALYFSAVLKGVRPETHCIGAAFAPDPAGPFVAQLHPMICQLDHRGSIDARTFVDTDGDLIMYWKSEDNANPGTPGPDQDGRTAVWAQHLSADGHTLLGSPVKIFQPDQPWEGTIVEAPDVIQVFGTYWLFFSANWYNSNSYGIGVAACRTAFGPCSDPGPAAFLGSNAQGNGPGEPSVYDDGADVYLLYNPWHSNDPAPTPPRPAVMARIGFRSSGPYLATP